MKNENEKKDLFIPVSRPSILKQDSQAVKSAVDSSFIAGGQNIIAFEKAISGFCRRRYGIAVSNGTSALTLAVKSLNLPPKSRILIPNFTIISALYAVKANNHIPVFAEVDKFTWNLTLESVKKEIDRGIAAAIIIETYSSSPPLREIFALLKKNRIKTIEDAAEGFGGSEYGQLFGSFGNVSIISFYANKLISTGEGGMILTDDKDLYEKIISLRNLCFDKERKFIHTDLSGNFRLTNVQAALGLSQFKRLQVMYNHRQKLYNLYLTLLSDLQNYLQFQVIPANIKSSYWVFPILLNKKLNLSAEELISRLIKKGVETRHFFYPLNFQFKRINASKKTKNLSFQLWKKGLYLPLGNGITQEEIRYVSKMLHKILKGYKIIK